MHFISTTLALLATTASFVVAHPQGYPQPTSSCWTSSTCSAVFSTHQKVFTDPYTVTSTSTRFDPVYITTTSEAYPVRTDLSTSSWMSTSSWEVTNSIKVPYNTSRVITIPYQTFSMKEVCTTSSTVIPQETVMTDYCTETSNVVNVVTTSTACYDPYPVTYTSYSTKNFVKSWTTCETSTGWTTPTGGW
jgi:hypothetical protein